MNCTAFKDFGDYLLEHQQIGRLFNILNCPEPQILPLPDGSFTELGKKVPGSPERV